MARSSIRWAGTATPCRRFPIRYRPTLLFPWALETLRAGDIVCFSSIDEIPNPIDRESYRSLGIRSAVTVPLAVAGRTVGAVGFNSFRRERAWSADELHMLRVFATAFGNVLARREGDKALRAALDEVVRLRDQLHAENVYLRAEVRDRSGVGKVLGESAAIRQTLELVDQVSATDSTVLLLGETGTGKELFASRIHDLSNRHTRAMVRVNCAAIPETLVESELFGREKGAFTGALARQIGRFELANHSTIFLDEIGDLPMQVQVKLLRVLEERSIERLGSSDVDQQSTPASSPPPTAIWSSGSPTGTSGKTSTTASTSSRFTCRRCASGSTTFRCWSGSSSSSSRGRSASRSRRFPPTTWPR